MAGSSDAEQRIRRLSYNITDLSRVVRKAKDDTASLYQGVMAAASRGNRGECTVTVSGQITGQCSTNPVPGAVLDFTAQPSGIIAGTATTDGSGNYSVPLSIKRSDTSIDYTITSPIPGLVATPGSIPTVTCNGTYTLNYQLNVDNVNYFCWFGCDDPTALAYNPTVHSPTYGDTVLTWDAINGRYVGQSNPAYTAYLTCTAKATIYLGYVLNINSGELDIYYTTLAGSGCPKLDATTTLPPGYGAFMVGITPTSTGCSFTGQWDFTPGVMAAFPQFFKGVTESITLS